jgi:uncharacterized protein
MIRRLLPAAALLLPLGTLPLPAAAQQQSQSYKFLEAIRKADGNTVNQMLGEPGQRWVEARDRSTGEMALHIVAKRGDALYTRFLLARGADANARDPRGNTPLLLAVDANAGSVIEALLAAKANVNLANGSGETPLIRAVQRRDLATVRDLLAAGANPDLRDRLAGLSAREYAERDTRAPGLLKVINEKPERPVNVDIAGPKL